MNAIAPLKAYIMVQRDDGYWLIGPFLDRADAGNWGIANWDRSPGHDDPRWQVIELRDPHAAPAVLSPLLAVGLGRAP